MKNKIEDSEPIVYVVPTNFIDSGRIVKGMFKTRNFVEAIVVGLFMFLILNAFPYQSISTKIILMIALIGPVVMMFLMGINDEPTSTFILSAIKWSRKKTVMLYNRNSEIQKMRAVDALMERELPREKIMMALNKWKSTRASKLEDMEYIEGENFIFATDEDIAKVNETAARRRAAAEAERAREEAASQLDMSTVDIEDDNSISVNNWDAFSEEFDDE